LYFSVPDWTANTGDLLVAEHTNHFTEVSIRRMTADAGLAIDQIDSASLPCAFAVLCHVSEERSATVAKSDVEAVVVYARSRASAWSDACRRLERTISTNIERSAAVFGAGFYGAFLLTRMADRTRVTCCVDNNHHLWGKRLFGIDVACPEALPITTEIVYVGLNPARARAIAATVPALQRPGLDLVFIED
jgi:FlaA1/EpsC-like NDP-sugar epimerase